MVTFIDVSVAGVFTNAWLSVRPKLFASGFRPYGGLA